MISAGHQIVSRDGFDCGNLQLSLFHVIQGDGLAARRWPMHVVTQTLTKVPLPAARTPPKRLTQDVQIGDTCFTPAELQEVTLQVPGEYRVVACWFSDETLSEIGEPYAALSRRFHEIADVADRSIARRLIEIGNEILSPGFSGAARSEALALEAIERVCRKFSDGRVSAMPGSLLTERQMQAVRHYAEAITGRKPSIGELAREFGVSNCHLMRMFKRTVGQPLHAYLEGVRLRRAMTELANTKHPMKEISYRLGFASHSGFSIAFRRSTGRTPKEFRDACKRWK